MGMRLADDLNAGLATRILDMSVTELEAFFRTCVRDRNLHKVVGDLNKQVLDGGPATRRMAEKALGHLGFVPY